jgi:hypothetical protein
VYVITGENGTAGKASEGNFGYKARSEGAKGKALLRAAVHLLGRRFVTLAVAGSGLLGAFVLNALVAFVHAVLPRIVFHNVTVSNAY